MKRALAQVVLILLVCMIFVPVPVYAQSMQSTIRVGLLSNQQKVSISADTKFEVINGDTGQVLAHFNGNQKADIVVKGKTLTINGYLTPGIDIHFLQLKTEREKDVKVNGKRYRGDVSIHMTHGKAGLTVVNTLPIEHYLYGVIAREMSPSWHIEALKAQTVAARSFVLYNLSKHQDDGYDVCGTSHCQVYGGRESEAPEIIKAVDDTAGQVLTYQGKLIIANFHSSSGGYTENSENVWGTYQPYLRGVVDYDQTSPHYKWEKIITFAQLKEALTSAGYKIGEMKAIDTSERGVSGRVKRIEFIGTSGKVTLTGEKLRKILNLKSTLFDMSVFVPVTPAAEFEIAKKTGDSDRKKNKINRPIQGKQSFLNKNKQLHSISGRPGESISIVGFGWGHGLGLSQWGAKAMAEQGPQRDATYYQEILKHYYQGTTIKKVF